MTFVLNGFAVVTIYFLLQCVVVFPWVKSLKTNVTCNAGTFMGKEVSVNIGGKTTDVIQFLGIPYAEAPVGELRFMKPVSKEPLETPFDATQPGASCIDLDVLVNGEINSSNGEIKTEDCLYLNIFVPHRVTVNKNLPVIVFLHETGQMFGPDMEHMGNVVTRIGDVVFVQVNYRLNIWGFSSTGDDIFPGNVGLWDQHLAIQWVNGNIEEFGGDPNLVTLLGYYEGAVNVIYQAMFSGNIGLFKRIIISCGGIRCPWSYNKYPSATTQMVGGAVGCYNETSQNLLECMQSKTTEEIISGIWNHRICVQFSYETITAVDGAFLTYPPTKQLNPYSVLGSRERQRLSSYEVLVDSYQTGSIRLVKVLRKSNYMMTMLEDELFDRPGKSNDGEMTHNETITLEYNNNKRVTLTRKDADYDKPEWEVARVIFGLDFDESPGMQLESDFDDGTCSKTVHQSFGCFLSSMATGGPTWLEHRTCPRTNGLVPNVSLYEKYGMAEDHFKPKSIQRPNIQDASYIFTFENMSTSVKSRLLPDEKSSILKPEVLQAAISVWVSFASSGTLSSVEVLNGHIICNKKWRMHSEHHALCRKHPFAALMADAGLDIGHKECQHQFRKSRWACESTLPYNEFVHGFQYRTATRESAAWSALSSAGILYAITQACNLGTLKECGCDDRKLNYPMWKDALYSDGHWGGCSADIRYGLRMARRFLYPHGVEKAAKILMIKHNNQAGRKVIKNNMVRECRCHGPTGSCQFKTCWLRLPSFRQVGDYLYKRFEFPEKVVLSRKDSHKLPPRLILKRSEGSDKGPSRSGLVYLEDSPSYCDYDAGVWSLGTVGRKCNGESVGVDGCVMMCCGRGYNTHEYTRATRCNCEPTWCCDDRCKTCNETVYEHTCK